ncbi:MAG: response regulator transcription factor [Phycisphaerales bacterium]|nr:MAG: response regulator transcription factor [Phycisphaerales bacterium]
MTVRVLLADDHRMMREGVRLILERAPGVEVVGEVENGRLAVEMTDQLRPDVVVMDIGMQDLNGIEATRQIKARHPKTKVIGLSMYSDKRYVLGMLEAGVSGYVLKGSAGAELIRAIQAAEQGGKYLSAEITDVVVSCYVDRDFPTDGSAYSALGQREREVLQLLAEGKTSKEIAAQLNVSAATVETHRRNIMKKLDLHSVAELTKYAVREGLTDIDQ